MAQPGTEQAVLWVGVVGALLAALYPIAKGRSVGDGRTRRFYHLAAGVGAALAAGYLLAATGVGTVSIGEVDPETAYWGRHLGWLLATAVALGTLWALTDAGRGALAELVALDAGVVGAGAVATLASTGAVDADVVGLNASELGLALWGAAGLALLALLHVMFRGLSRRASALAVDAAALFSVVRNLLAAGLAASVIVGALGAGGAGVLSSLVTLAAFLAVDLLTVAGVVAILAGGREAIQSAVEGRTGTLG